MVVQHGIQLAVWLATVIDESGGVALVTSVNVIDVVGIGIKHIQREQVRRFGRAVGFFSELRLVCGKDFPEIQINELSFLNRIWRSKAYRTSDPET